jgi:hypothetical protein
MRMRKQMALLIQNVRQQVQAGKDHREICVQVAEEFDLVHEDRFPIWLSRIVEGEQRDAEQNEINEDDKY